MRKAFRGIGAVLICGKNTHMRAAINELNTPPAEDDEEYTRKMKDYKPRPHLEKLV